MIFPVIYAVVIWFLAAKFRRQWQGVVTVVLGLALLGMIAASSMGDEQHRWASRLGVVLPGWLQRGIKLLMVLLVPYAAMVGIIGGFLVCLPRSKVNSGCKNCGYDLAGLNPLGLICPECGHEQGPFRCKQCKYDLRGQTPLGLKCPECGQPWKGPGSGREHEPEVLVPIPKQPLKKGRVNL